MLTQCLPEHESLPKGRHSKEVGFPPGCRERERQRERDRERGEKKERRVLKEGGGDGGGDITHKLLTWSVVWDGGKIGRASCRARV